jgi:hypothetical protein
MKRIIKISLLILWLNNINCAHSRSQNQLRRDIRNTIQSQSSTILECYNEALKTTPTLKGKVEIALQVERKTGLIHSVKVKESTLNNPKVEQCIVNVVEGLYMPDPVDYHLKYTQPITFQAVPQTPQTTKTPKK